MRDGIADAILRLTPLIFMAHHKIISEEDFLEAYDEYADGIFRHCFLRINDREQSKELMCEVFRRLWFFIINGNYVDSIKIFLYREANVLVERQQQTAAKKTSAPDASLAFLQDLAPEQQSICILHYVDGFSMVEIGEIVGGNAREHVKTLREIGKKVPLQPLHV